MPSMPERTETSVVVSPEQRPNSWGFGDGQAIPWEYAPAPEARDIVTLKERYGLFIGGRSVPAAGGATFTSIDPSTERPLADVAKASDVDVDKAVRAARRAQQARRRETEQPVFTRGDRCTEHSDHERQVLHHARHALDPDPGQRPQCNLRQRQQDER